MRILIDLQGAQSKSRFRGIGRYSFSLAHAIAKNKGTHDVIVALSNMFPNTISPLTDAFRDVLPAKKITTWHAVPHVSEYLCKNSWRRLAAEIIREHFYTALMPDIVFVSSYMEGFTQDVVTDYYGSIETPTTILTLYDLIPLLNPQEYLSSSVMFEKHYMRKINKMKEADGLLAISDYSTQEGIHELNLSPDKITSIFSGCDEIFKENPHVRLIPTDFNITRPYLLYTGGADKRKNLPNLIRAYAMLPNDIRAKYQLVIVGEIKNMDKIMLKLIASSCSLNSNDIIFTGYISDTDLVKLYNKCTLFVFPSWHEGFGLPALEAINCGAPVIGSNTSSLPEVIGCRNALFDPFDINNIAEVLKNALTDEKFRKELQETQFHHAKRFSWDISALRAISFFEKIEKKTLSKYCAGKLSDNIISSIARINNCSPSDSDLLNIAEAINKNTIELKNMMSRYNEQHD